LHSFLPVFLRLIKFSFLELVFHKEKVLEGSPLLLDSCFRLLIDFCVGKISWYLRSISGTIFSMLYSLFFFLFYFLMGEYILISKKI